MHNKLFLMFIIFLFLVSCKENNNSKQKNHENENIALISEKENNKNESDIQPIKKERISKRSYGEIPEDIIDEIYDVEYDGDLYFFELNINDSPETVKVKLTKQGYEFEEEYDNYLKIHAIWNKGMIQEERINMNFMICFYKNKLYSFDKYSLSLEEAQCICNHFGSDFDVSLLKLPQYYKIKKKNWIISIGNNRNMNVLSIYDDVVTNQVTEKYMTLE